MYQAIVFLPLLGSILAALIALAGARARFPGKGPAPEAENTVTDRGPHHHGEPVGAGRDDMAFLLPRRAGDDEQHPVECELMAGRARGGQMPDMDGVERAAQDAEPLHRRSVRERPMNGVLQPT